MQICFSYINFYFIIISNSFYYFFIYLDLIYFKKFYNYEVNFIILEIIIDNLQINFCLK